MAGHSVFALIERRDIRGDHFFLAAGKRAVGEVHTSGDVLDSHHRLSYGGGIDSDVHASELLQCLSSGAVRHSKLAWICPMGWAFA